MIWWKDLFAPRPEDVELFKKIISEGKYTYYGIRAHRPGEKAVVGESLGVSMATYDDRPLGYDCDGICTIGIEDPEHVEHTILHVNRSYRSSARHQDIVLVGGESASGGDDHDRNSELNYFYDELVIADNVCLAILSPLMDGKVLRATGEALYGSRWQSDLARDLGVSDRTIRRWLADRVPADIAPRVAKDLKTLCESRSAALGDAGKWLDITIKDGVY